MRYINHVLVLLAIAIVASLAACNGSGVDNTPILPGTPTSIMLPAGGGAIFPAGSFAAETNVLVSDELTDAQRDAAGFPPDAGTLLGATRIEVPQGAVLAHDITVMVALAEPIATNVQFTIFAFNSATNMWGTTEAGAAALRGTSAQGHVMEGNVVTFTAPTEGTTGLNVAYGVFSGYQGQVTANHIPTVDLTTTSNNIAPSAEVTLTATGADTDSDALTFTWLAPGGTLGAPVNTATTSTATWTATAAGTYIVSVSCSDGKGGVATDMVTILVGVANDAPAWTESGTPPTAIKGDVPAPVTTQKIWVKGTAADANGDALTVTWSDDTGAAGNFTNATFDPETGAAAVYWAYGTVGTYTITGTVDDGKGATDVASFQVTLAELPTEFSVVGAETCGACHVDKLTEWQTTNHSKALETSVNVDLGHGFRNQACYKCHGAGIWPAGTGGFIDQELTPQFANIQCESCHGGGNPAGMGAGHKAIQWDPGKGYVKDGTGKYVPDAQGAYTLDAAYDGSEGYGCGLCHEGSRHGAFEEWNKSGHANYALTEDDAGTEVVGPAGEPNCVKCHNGQYFVSVQIKGEAPPTENLAVEDLIPYAMNINCATCHDTHNATNEKQLRVGNTETVIIPWDDTPVNGGWGNICLKCHNGRRTRADYDGQVTNPGSSMRGPHGNAQGALFFGLMGADFAGAPVDYDTDHPHRTWNANSCVTCHMYRRDYISSSEPALFGHDWEPRIERCVTCHTNYTVEQSVEFWAWVEEFQTTEIQSRLDAFVAAWPAEWKDVTDPANPELRHKESAPGAGDGPSADEPGDIYRELLWNYKLINSDATKGVHNPTYAESILDKSTARLIELTAAP